MIDQLVEHCTAIKVTAGYVHGVTCINYISLYCMTDSPYITSVASVHLLIPLAMFLLLLRRGK